MQRSIVLLPEPDAPMMLMTSPFFTLRLMSRRTAWSPNCFCRCTSSITLSATAQPSFVIWISALTSVCEPKIV